VLRAFIKKHLGKILKSSSYSRGFDARTDGIFATPLRSKTSCRRCRRRRRARFKEHFRTFRFAPKFERATRFAHGRDKNSLRRPFTANLHA
jgi:hypothetical protein